MQVEMNVKTAKVSNRPASIQHRRTLSGRGFSDLRFFDVTWLSLLISVMSNPRFSRVRCCLLETIIFLGFKGLPSPDFCRGKIFLGEGEEVETPESFVGDDITLAFGATAKSGSILLLSEIPVVKETREQHSRYDARFYFWRLNH